MRASANERAVAANEITPLDPLPKCRAREVDFLRLGHQNYRHFVPERPSDGRNRLFACPAGHGNHVRAEPREHFTDGPGPQFRGGPCWNSGILKECHARKRHLRARMPVVLRTARVLLNREEVAMRPESCQTSDMVGPKVVKQDGQFHSSVTCRTSTLHRHRDVLSRADEDQSIHWCCRYAMTTGSSGVGRAPSVTGSLKRNRPHH